MRVSCRQFNRLQLSEAAMIAMNEVIEQPINIIDLFIRDWSSVDGDEKLVVLIDYCFRLYEEGELKLDEFLKLVTLPCKGTIPCYLIFKRFRDADTSKLFKTIIRLMRDIYNHWHLERVTLDCLENNLLQITYCRAHGPDIVIEAYR